MDRQHQRMRSSSATTGAGGVVARPPGDEKRWVFIAGEGRSGSTLLGVLAAKLTRAFNCGELAGFWRRHESGGRCECGAEVSSCEIWAAVASDVRRSLGARFASAIASYNSRYFAISGVRLPRPDAEAVALRSATERAIERVTGASLFVDASKVPYTLAAALLRERPLHVIHLVRDPRGVAYSWHRPKTLPQVGTTLARKPVWRTSLKWTRNNYLIERLLARAARGPGAVASTRLTYEGFIREPLGALAPIVESIRPDPERVWGARGHAIAGNSALYDHRPIEFDDRWTRDMPGYDKFVATALTVPLIWHYGYPVLPRRPA